MHTILTSISNFSILRGVLSPQTICKLARDLGYSSVALTDRNNLYGLPSFLHWCKEYELTPIIGAETTGPDGDAILYADGDRGFSNLCRIISECHCNKNFQLVQSILSDNEGLHIATANLSIIDKLNKKCSVYYRMERPRIPPSQIRSNKIPCIIAPPMVFSRDIDIETHSLLRAIDCNTTMSKLSKSEIFENDSFFMSCESLLERFENFDYALEATGKFTETICSRNVFGTPVMPSFEGDRSSKELLRKKAFEGASHRYNGLPDAVVTRLNYELNLIESKGFADYFLIVDDIVKQSPRTCGRGSGAASIVAYSLGITNVDPIRYNLMFERFLNPGRIDPPDIDIDFAWDERDGVLDYVFKRYSEKHTAMVATHLTCGARMAIREVARIFGLTEGEISPVTKRIPYYVDLPENAENLQEFLMQWPAFKSIELDHPWPQIFEKAARIIGIPRGIGTHCGGVIVTPMPINSVAPVQFSAKGYPIIQWEKDGAEEMGLVKIDLLGNRSLAVIRDAIENIKREGIPFDEHRWDPQADQATIDLFARGDSMGVFYVESPAMRLLQKKTQAGDFEHLVIHSSIIRPAANKYIQDYIKRLHGDKYELLHPKLGKILSETYGIMVYQEDVSKVAMAIADFSVEDADTLRKIMSKKTRGRKFEDFHIKFVDGARKNNLIDATINEIWEMMLSFSGYSFCKPHSASYVQVSFQSGYLKAHYPAAFMAAVLSNYGGYYSTQAYISEAQRLGIIIIPPDVNKSFFRYYSEDNTIIVGLCQIKGISARAQELVVTERQNNGNFATIDDLLNRCGIDEPDAEKLIFAGACDNLSTGSNRARQFWQIRQYFRLNRNGPIPELKILSNRQFLQYQYRTLGFLTSCHPITLVNCSEHKRIKTADIKNYVGKHVKILGWCITSKTVSTKLGKSMEFVTFEDETGLVETVFFPNVYKAYASILEYHEGFLISGVIQEEFGVATLEVRKLERPA
jgi:DNA polymerase-3 subunit alpha/error-prone DNA polymerase